MSAGQLARQRSSSSGTRPSLRSATPIDPRVTDVDFEACAATASYFIYTQGPTIICLHHDTLAIERRFDGGKDGHEEPIVFLCADNVSERGAGRLLVSYDAGKVAIVWDLFTGQQVARFGSYHTIGAAAWMRNGNIGFGNTEGSIILFQPQNSEHISARTINDPITAIAPAWDCQTYAVGYQNGSILIVGLQPSFTILHTLTAARSPSAVANLVWHASSTKQRSDMLATQTVDGDLRVWSVSKPPSTETPKILRVLKRRDNVEPGLHWCAWSKNGRILQYSDGETWSWDVRTKHVTCEPIPTVEGVRGVVCYGPQATLFTLGPNHTVQQYDTNPPALAKEVQYLPMAPPPAPIIPNPAQRIPGAAPPIAVSRGSETDRGAVSLSTIQKTSNEMQAIEHARQLRDEMASPLSSTSRTSRTDTMSTTSSNRGYPRHIPSISSRAQSGTTFSTISPSMVGRDSLFSGTTSIYPSTASMASSGRRSKGSRLRQEVVRSPESSYLDLFPRSRIRLANMTYEQPEPLDQENMTSDDLRRRMLEVVFGWSDDIEALMKDELLHQQPGSQSAVLLSKWLGDVDSDMMTASGTSDNVSEIDWMMMALSNMGASGSMNKMGENMVQRLLRKGDFHTAATILLSLGDREDAVEVYVSRSFYMEAILLTCLAFPTDWQRQAHLVRRWGEFVVENSQQHLAIRCFSCTGVEPPIPWSSPSPRAVNTPSQTPPSISSMLSPPVSPPGTAPLTRMTTKNSALKVITSFEAPAQAQFKFPGLASTDRTPTNGPGVTPIAESAISPGGTPGGFDRRQARGMNSLAGRMITPGGYHRNRLPSIGETPVDVKLPGFPRPSQLPTPDNSGSDAEKERENHLRSQTLEAKIEKESEEAPPLLLSSARYDPGTPATGKTPMTAVPQTSVRTTILPNPSEESFSAFKEKSRIRNGSRDRKPDGLHIRMPSQDQIQTTHFISPAGISSQPAEHRKSNTLNSLHSAGLSTGQSDTRSPSISGQSWASAKSPSVSGRSIDQYISSLEEAGSRSRKTKHRSEKRGESREGRPPKSRSKNRTHERSEDRGRDDRRYVRPAKRSPSSPKPMSPETYLEPNNVESIDSQVDDIRSPASEGRYIRDDSRQPKIALKIRSGSKASDYSHRTVRHRSPEGVFDSNLGSEASFNRSKASSRQPSPRGLLDPNGRGRSKSKNKGSIARSPSSPLPMSMSPQAQFYQASDEDDDPLGIVEANRQRLRSRHRSGSRRPRERGNSSRREKSPDRRRAHEEYHLRVPDIDEPRQQPRSAVEPRRVSGDQMLEDVLEPKLERQKSARTQKKEIAARELEARRESLLRNPEAPPILHPDEVSNGRPIPPYRAQTDLSNSPTSWHPVVSQYESRKYPVTPVAMENGDFTNRAASVGPYGLPATPRAMRHPRYDKPETIPAVPEIPESIQPLPEMYYTGHPMREFPRSLSAPVPDQHPPMPVDLPTHPAFHKALRPGKRLNFSPLGDIGQNRHKRSSDSSSKTHAPFTAGIDETLHAADSGIQVINVDDPPLLPELQHLSMPPPPPPPPAPFPYRNDPESSSLSSNSNVGVIKMVLDNEPEDEAHVIEVPPPPPEIISMRNTRSPPIGTTASPPPSLSRSGSAGRHHRGRSDNFKNGIKGITDRLRSTSRGRNTKSPEQVANTPSPYESVPPLYF